MNSLWEMLKPDFILHHALYGSVAVGLVCPLVGVYLLLKRLVFWGVALPQVSAAGIAFAFMLQGFGFALLSAGESREKHLAILGSVVFTVLAILLLALLERRGQSAGEGQVGALYAAASCAAMLFVAWNAAGETEMLGLLKGEIVSISESDFHMMLNIFGGISLALFLFQKEFLLVCYDRDLSVVLGRNAAAWEILLYLLIGLTISLGVMTVGPVVIFGFLVVPPMAALPWARGMTSFSVLASLIGGFSAFCGFYLSYRYDLPLGPVAVACACGGLLLSTLLQVLRPGTVKQP